MILQCGMLVLTCVLLFSENQVYSCTDNNPCTEDIEDKTSVHNFKTSDPTKYIICSKKKKYRGTERVSNKKKMFTARKLLNVGL